MGEVNSVLAIQGKVPAYYLTSEWTYAVSIPVVFH